MPISSQAMKRMSSTMFTTDEMARETRGVLLSPREVRAVENRFISAVTRKPIHRIRR